MLTNVQLDVWERLDGRRPIQLSIEGTSPVPVLEDLAADTAFRGRLLVGVTPGLFFSGFTYREEFFDFPRKETPADRASQWLSMRLVEPVFAFYEPAFALFAVLKRQPRAQRPAAEERLDVPAIFTMDRDRSARLWRRFETDSAYRGYVQRIWAQNFGAPRIAGAQARQAGADRQRLQIERSAAAVKTLRARGVTVIFVRHPSSGALLEDERTKLPRDKTWDVLLAETGARCTHFEDYPALQGFTTPEWSHIAASEADRYTEALYAIVAAAE
jgi:hypothetical protein